MDMFRFLEITVLFLLAYKLIRTLFVDEQPKQRVQQQPPRQTFENQYRQQTNTTTNNNNSRFNDAEFIDYEKVK